MVSPDKNGTVPTAAGFPPDGPAVVDVPDPVAAGVSPAPFPGVTAPFRDGGDTPLALKVTLAESGSGDLRFKPARAAGRTVAAAPF